MKLSPCNYFSPSAFAEREAEVIVKVLPENHQLSMGINSYKTITVYNFNYKLRIFKDSNNNNNGWLIRDYINSKNQCEIYKYIQEISTGSEEHDKIKLADPKNPFPLAYYNLVYTGKSNCFEPIKLFQLSQDVWDLLQLNPNAEFLKHDVKFNSMYAQLFAKGKYIINYIKMNMLIGVFQ